MRITGDVVRRVGDWAKDATGGAFVFQSFGGGRYIDGKSLTRGWKGPTAAREAAAYYGHGAARWCELAGTEVPGWVRDLLTVVDKTAARKVAAAAALGRTDADDQWRVHERESEGRS